MLAGSARGRRGPVSKATSSVNTETAFFAVAPRRGFPGRFRCATPVVIRTPAGSTTHVLPEDAGETEVHFNHSVPGIPAVGARCSAAICSSGHTSCRSSGVADDNTRVTPPDITKKVDGESEDSPRQQQQQYPPRGCCPSPTRSEDANEERGGELEDCSRDGGRFSRRGSAGSRSIGLLHQQQHSARNRATLRDGEAVGRAAASQGVTTGLHPTRLGGHYSSISPRASLQPRRCRSASLASSGCVGWFGSSVGGPRGYHFTSFRRDSSVRSATSSVAGSMSGRNQRARSAPRSVRSNSITAPSLGGKSHFFSKPQHEQPLRTVGSARNMMQLVQTGLHASLWVATQDGMVEIRSMVEPTTVLAVLPRRNARTIVTAIVQAAGNGVAVAFSDGSLHLYDAYTLCEVHFVAARAAAITCMTLASVPAAATTSTTTTSYQTPTGLASGRAATTARVIVNLGTTTSTATASGSTGTLRATVLLTGSLDGSIGKWDAVNLAPLGRLVSGDDKGISALACPANSWYLFSGSENGVIRMWDLVNDAQVIATQSLDKSVAGGEKQVERTKAPMRAGPVPVSSSHHQRTPRRLKLDEPADHENNNNDDAGRHRCAASIPRRTTRPTHPPSVKPEATPRRQLFPTMGGSGHSEVLPRPIILNHKKQHKRKGGSGGGGSGKAANGTAGDHHGLGQPDYFFDGISDDKNEDSMHRRQVPRKPSFFAPRGSRGSGEVMFVGHGADISPVRVVDEELLSSPLLPPHAAIPRGAAAAHRASVSGASAKEPHNSLRTPATMEQIVKDFEVLGITARGRGGGRTTSLSFSLASSTLLSSPSRCCWPEMNAHAECITSLAIVEELALLISASRDGTAKVFAIPSGAPICTLGVQRKVPLRAVVVDAPQQRVYVGSSDGALAAYDMLALDKGPLAQLESSSMAFAAAFVPMRQYSLRRFFYSHVVPAEPEEEDGAEESAVTTKDGSTTPSDPSQQQNKSSRAAVLRVSAVAETDRMTPAHGPGGACSAAHHVGASSLREVGLSVACAELQAKALKCRGAQRDILSCCGSVEQLELTNQRRAGVFLRKQREFYTLLHRSYTRWRLWTARRTNAKTTLSSIVCCMGNAQREELTRRYFRQWRQFGFERRDEHHKERLFCLTYRATPDDPVVLFGMDSGRHGEPAKVDLREATSYLRRHRQLCLARYMEQQSSQGMLCSSFQNWREYARANVVTRRRQVAFNRLLLASVTGTTPHYSPVALAVSCIAERAVAAARSRRARLLAEVCAEDHDRYLRGRFFEIWMNALKAARATRVGSSWNLVEPLSATLVQTKALRRRYFVKWLSFTRFSCQAMRLSEEKMTLQREWFVLQNCIDNPASLDDLRREENDLQVSIVHVAEERANVAQQDESVKRELRGLQSTDALRTLLCGYQVATVQDPFSNLNADVRTRRRSTVSRAVYPLVGANRSSGSFQPSVRAHHRTFSHSSTTMEQSMTFPQIEWSQEHGQAMAILRALKGTAMHCGRDEKLLTVAYKFASKLSIGPSSATISPMGDRCSGAGGSFCAPAHGHPIGPGAAAGDPSSSVRSAGSPDMHSGVSEFLPGQHTRCHPRTPSGSSWSVTLTATSSRAVRNTAATGATAASATTPRRSKARMWAAHPQEPTYSTLAEAFDGTTQQLYTALCAAARETGVDLESGKVGPTVMLGMMMRGSSRGGGGGGAGAGAAYVMNDALSMTTCSSVGSGPAGGDSLLHGIGTAGCVVSNGHEEHQGIKDERQRGGLRIHFPQKAGLSSVSMEQSTFREHSSTTTPTAASVRWLEFVSAKARRDIIGQVLKLVALFDSYAAHSEMPVETSATFSTRGGTCASTLPVTFLCSEWAAALLVKHGALLLELLSPQLLPRQCQLLAIEAPPCIETEGYASCSTPSVPPLSMAALGARGDFEAFAVPTPFPVQGGEQASHSARVVADRGRDSLSGSTFSSGRGGLDSRCWSSTESALAFKGSTITNPETKVIEPRHIPPAPTQSYLRLSSEALNSVAAATASSGDSIAEAGRAMGHHYSYSLSQVSSNSGRGGRGGGGGYGSISAGASVASGGEAPFQGAHGPMHPGDVSALSTIGGGGHEDLLSASVSQYSYSAVTSPRSSLAMTPRVFVVPGFAGGKKPYLGFRVNVSRDGTTGRSVISVKEIAGTYLSADHEETEGPGAAAGMRVGDQLVRFAGYAVTDLAAFNAIISRHVRAGAELPVVVQRAGEQLNLMITVGVRAS